MRHAQLAVFALLGMTLPVFAQQATPTTVPVGTVVAEKKAITPSLEFVGRVEAINRVDDRSEKAITTLLPEVQPYARPLMTRAAQHGIAIKVIRSSHV